MVVLLKVRVYCTRNHYLFLCLDIVKAARDKASLVRAMGEEFHALVRSRLEEDSDYSAERFPNAQKFYQPNKK